MTIKQGFFFIAMALLGWIAGCYVTEYFYPVKEKTYVAAWYGEIGFHCEYPPEAEIGRLDYIYDVPRQNEPKDDQRAE